MSFSQYSGSQKIIKAPDPEALEEDERQYGHGPLSKEEMRSRYPHRPINHSKTLPFHDLFISLFNPLNDNKKKPPGPNIARRKQGPNGPSKLNPHDARKAIIERFFSRWRQEVGDDIYPALRLIIPEKDRDRAMYGLKEKAIGKLLVKLMKIDKNSEDAYHLLNWKLPGQATRMAGDFAGRCFEVLSKRPMRTEVGIMRIAEVNELLDRLSAAQKEEHQLPIFEKFYDYMNPEELTWLIRIILRQMKVGASEKTILNIWHPEGETLFNVSSSLRRVAWELKDHSIRLDENESKISLMNCFQPQLAQFQMKSFQKVVDNMRPVEHDPIFWIEEKLDGERMQLHMSEDKGGSKLFSFWSRKAKDYTYLYGSSYHDENSSLTRHIKNAFDPRAQNLILDGEMITWDVELDMAAPFGTLKTAALSEQRNPFQGTGQRPLFRVFDILYLNDKVLTQYTLRDRRKALESTITDVPRRLEKHKYKEATTAAEIEPELRQVVEQGLEGLVLKNPRSSYKLNERNDDWTKVKPEYMDEFGESLDCIIIGGYYGSGHRGGRLSSFLCGLRVDKNRVQMGANPMKCWSFFKVGGGFRADDYQNIRHHTDGRWIEFDPKRPPLEYIELGGKDHAQFERPDVWIKPCDSVVVEVKAASVAASEQFRTGFTLRFPRFKRLRMDKDWTTALDIAEFVELKVRVEAESKEKKFNIDTRRKATKKRKKEMIFAGSEGQEIKSYLGPATKIFENLNFCVLSEAVVTPKMTKSELEQLVKHNGGNIFQNPSAKEDMICVADKKVVKVASLLKTGNLNIIRPKWLFDTIAQAEIDVGQPNFLLPFEPQHMYFSTISDEEKIKQHVDKFGDSFARDISADDLRKLFKSLKIDGDRDQLNTKNFLDALSRHGHNVSDLKGWLFRRLTVYMDFKFDSKKSSDKSAGLGSRELEMRVARNTINFAGGMVVEDIHDLWITHVVLSKEYGSPRLPMLRKEIAKREKVPRIVTVDWVEDSWREGTLLDEERYVPVGK